MELLFEQDRYEWNTLTLGQSARRRRWGFSVCLSSALHGLVAAVLCWPTAPVFVKPVQIARGEGGSATPLSVVLYVPDRSSISDGHEAAFAVTTGFRAKEEAADEAEQAD